MGRMGALKSFRKRGVKFTKTNLPFTFAYLILLRHIFKQSAVYYTYKWSAVRVTVSRSTFLIMRLTPEMFKGQGYNYKVTFADFPPTDGARRRSRCSQLADEALSHSFVYSIFHKLITGQCGGFKTLTAEFLL